MTLLDRLSSRAGRAARTTQRRADLVVTGDRGPRIGSVIGTGILGAAAGAIASFLLDPARGRARRARVRDQGAATARRIARTVRQASNRARSDIEGRVSAMRASRDPDTRAIDDATLGDRIQSSVFRDAALGKGSINLNVERGVVVLRGEVPDQATRERLVAEVEVVDGVWTVRDLLHLPGEEAVSVNVG